MRAEIVVDKGNPHVTEAITLLGGCAATARLFGVCRSAVHQWTFRGVPANRVMALSRMVENKITPEQIRPDVFVAMD